jgi:hypothetical protein
LVDLFEAMYQQAGLLSNGRPAEMGLREMCPKWLPSQYQRGRVKSDCNVLATDKLQCWLKNMEDIDTKYSTLALPAANYFQGCGGTDAIERLIDSDKKIMHGDYVYAPAFFTGKAITFRRFAPFDMLLLRKQVMNGVSLCIVYHLIVLATDRNHYKLAYLVGGWIAWNMAGNQSSPSERAAYPCPLIQSGEGVLIMYLSGYDLGENLYEYYHWWDQCKDQFQTVRSFILILFWVCSSLVSIDQ